MSRYRLGVYQDRHLPLAARYLHDLHGSPVGLAAAYLRWKYVDNPYIQPPLVYLALKDDRVVGMRGMFGLLLEGGDAAPISVVASADTAIDPGYRDQGLYSELSEFAFADLASRGHDVVLSLSPTAANYLTLVISMGWHPVGSFDLLVRGNETVTSPEPTTSEPGTRARGTTLRRFAGPLALAARPVRRAVGTAPFSAFDRQIARLSNNAFLQVTKVPTPQRMMDLLKHIGSDGRIRHVRDHAYLSWRYQNPFSDYRFLYWGRGEQVSYMVLGRKSRSGLVRILDWEATEPEAANSLLDVVMGAGFNDVRVWGSSLSPETLDLLNKA